MGLYLGVPGSLGFTVNGMTFETTEVLQVSVSLAGLGAMQFTGPRSWPAELPMTDRLHVSLGLSQTGSPSSLFSSDELPWSIDFSKVDSRTGAIIGGAGEQWYGMEVTLDPTVTTSIIIPEPGSASLLAIGLLPFVLGFLGRRRRFRRHC